MSDYPFFKFVKCLPSATYPLEADNSASGLLLTKAYRYCEPARIASSLGWYLFPVMDFTLKTDGRLVYIYLDNDWVELDEFVVEEEELSFDELAPEYMRGSCPPLIGTEQTGIIQLWTGIFTQSKNEWGLLIRRPPNVPYPYPIELYEGFVNTSRWLGPLFLNFKILETNTPVTFKADWPIAFAQPLNWEHYHLKEVKKQTEFCELDSFNVDDWSQLSEVIFDRQGAHAENGKFTKVFRKKP